METLNELFEDQIQDLHSAEKQLTKALPALAKKASTQSLKDAFTMHLEETKGHVERLEQIGEQCGFKVTGKTCKAMEGLVKEGEEAIDEDGDSMVVDASLIAAAQRVEHYEISAYGTVRALAEQLGYDIAVRLLRETQDEESAADEKLNRIALEELLPNAPVGEFQTQA